MRNIAAGVQYSSAWDAEKKVMLAVEGAPRGKGGLLCPDPECESEMVAAKGLKNVWHFRHAKNPCSGYLHHACVRWLVRRLDELIKSGSPLQIRYPCVGGCSGWHDVPAFVWRGQAVKQLKKERRAVENSMVMPDITLQDKDAKALALVEVVDTHFPESRVFEVGLPVIIVNASHLLIRKLSGEGLRELLEVEAIHNVPCPTPPPPPPTSVPPSPPTPTLPKDRMQIAYEEEAEWIDLLGNMGVKAIEAQPILMNVGEVAAGYLVKVEEPTIEGKYPRWILRHPDDERFTLPIAIHSIALPTALASALMGTHVLIRYDSDVERVSRRTGQKYQHRNFSISPLPGEGDTPSRH